MKKKTFLLTFIVTLALFTSLVLAQDLNSDDKVNINDIQIVASSYGTRPGETRWNSKADLDKNGKIDIMDISTVAKNYGKSDSGTGVSETSKITPESEITDISSSLYETTTKVYVDPSEVVYSGFTNGNTFTIDIKIQDVTDLFAWETVIIFNTKILRFKSIEFSDFLGSPEETFFHYVDLQEDRSTIAMFAIRLGNIGGVSGSGKLVSVTFDVIDIGETDLDLVTTTLLKLLFPDPFPIENVVINDGYFNNKFTQLVGYWKFNEDSGLIASDSSGNGNDGTLSNPGRTEGMVGKALSFDGQDDYVRINDHDSLDLQNAITIAAWIYPTDWPSSYPRIVSKEVSTDADPYALELDRANKRVMFCLKTSENPTKEICTNTDSNSIELNKWYHVVGTWDGANTKIYLNGEFIDSKHLEGTLIATANDVLIGNNPSTTKPRQFKGIIDEVKIFSKALSEDEIKNEYLNSYLVGYWKFDERGGTFASDSSYYDNTGTLEGGLHTTGWTNTDCKLDSCLQFDGQEGYVDLPKDYMTAGKSELTLEFWIKPDEWVSTNTIWDEFAYGNYWQFTIRSDKWRTRDSSTDKTGARNNDLSLPNVPIDGKWHHLVFVYSVSQSLKAIYYDGELYSSTSTSVDTLTSARDAARIGYAIDGTNFDGGIDEIRIYNKALTEDEIKNKYLNSFLVAYWKFDEGSGQTVSDSSYYNNGTLYGGLDTGWSTTECKLSSCLQFDGTNDYINCGNNPSLNFEGEITVSAWLKPDTLQPWARFVAAPNNFIMPYTLSVGGTGGTSSNVQFGYMLDGENYRQKTKGTPLTSGEWHHVVGIGRDGTIKIYVDVFEQPQELASVEQITYKSGTGLYIGSRQDGNSLEVVRYKGKIDEIKIFNKALSGDEAIVVAAGAGTMCYEEYGASSFCDRVEPGTNDCDFDCRYVVDIDANDNVNILDLTFVAKTFGSFCDENTCPKGYSCHEDYSECDHHPDWDPKIDLNQDGRINIQDITMTAKQFGKTAQ